MSRNEAMNLIDSVKTYIAAFFGFITTSMDCLCGFLDQLTTIFAFLLVLVCLVRDFPKAHSAWKSWWVKRFRRSGRG